jgi:antitoxin component YwqK of YwqJK toxin-antitoxin module
MKNLIILLFITLFLSCTATNKTIISRWKNGNIKKEKLKLIKYFSDNDNYGGGTIKYYSNGKKEYKVINYSSISPADPNSKQINEEIYWYDSGKKAYSEICYNGILTEGKYYNLSSQPVSKLEKQTGTRKIFFNNGNIMFIEKMNKGLITEGIYYNSKGQVVSKIINGNGKMTQHYLTGELRMFAEYQKGVTEGKVRWYYKNGQPEHFNDIKNGIVIRTEYYDNIIK